MLRALAIQSRIALSSRCFSVTAIHRADLKTFEAASKLVSTLSEEPDNDVKLKLYGLFKQSTEGKCTKGKPGVMDFIGRAKWEAWNSLGSMPQEKARDEYVTLVYKLAGQTPPSAGVGQAVKSEKAAANVVQPSTKQPSAEKVVSNSEIVSRLDDSGVLHLTFNRPTKFNALTMNMYESFAEQLERAAQDERVHFTVVRGTGTYFTAGNDLANFASAGSAGSLHEALASRFPIIRRFIYAFMEHPKVIIAAVNGPGIGIGATLLAHCDFVYAAKSAWLQTPFMKLGLLPEAGSSYTFPRALGPTLAKRMLILGEKLTVQQLEHTGFITQVIDDDKLDAFVDQRIAELIEMPKYSLQKAKQLSREADLNGMRRATELEFQAIAEGFQRPEVLNCAIKGFMELQSKKKK